MITTEMLVGFAFGLLAGGVAGMVGMVILVVAKDYVDERSIGRMRL